MPERQQTQRSTESKSTVQKQATPIIQAPISNLMAIIQRARINPKSLTHADVMQLQRTIGNRAVGRLLSEIRSFSTAQQAPVQRQEIPDEEKTCPSCMQRQEIPEEEEPLQGKPIEPIQRQEPKEDEKLQITSVMQRQEIPEEEPLQGKMIGTVQRQEIPEEEELFQTKRENNTGMPDNLKAGVENLSGIDMSDVRVHYNSHKPVEVGALAYTQGMEIHVAQGQERHLPHEAWHVVQQTQGRVKPTMQLKDGISVNDSEELEREADVMGAEALKMRRLEKGAFEFPIHTQGIQREVGGHRVVLGNHVHPSSSEAAAKSHTTQMKIGFEMQSTWIIMEIGSNVKPDSKDVIYRGAFFQIEVDRGKTAELEIVTYPLADRTDFDNAMLEIRYIVNLLTSAKSQIFTIGPGNGWIDKIKIKRTSEKPTFRIQYTEGVTMENIPSLIQQLHPEAWKYMPKEVKGFAKKPDCSGEEPAGRKRKIKEADDEIVPPKQTKLRGLIAAILMYLGDTANFRPEKKDDTLKYAHALMARTDFYSMFHALDKKEKTEFQDAIADNKKDFYGYSLDEPVYKKMESIKLTVRAWLQSMVNGRPLGKARKGKKRDIEPKDLMSPPPGFASHAQMDKEKSMKYAMGMYKFDGDLALFEARAIGSALSQDVDASEDILETVLLGTGGRDAAFAAKGDAKEKRPHRREASSGKDRLHDLLGDKDKAKFGEDYMPTLLQVKRMEVHRRKLEWIDPNGQCMLGALSHVSGKGIEEIRGSTIMQLQNPDSKAAKWLAEYAPQYSSDEVIEVLKNLLERWNDNAADTVLPVVALVLDVPVTVIQPDGTPLPIHGGGTILLHVTNPCSHYHSTLPA